MIDFYLYRLQLQFRVLQGPISFAPGQAGNLIRGALGNSLHRLSCVSLCPEPKRCPFAEVCLYRRIFAPSVDGLGPSGLADPPRPLVLRTAHLDGARLRAGERFWAGLHVFDLAPATVQALTLASVQLARDVELESVVTGDGVIYAQSAFRSQWPPPERVNLVAAKPVGRVRVRFRTATEIKGLANPRKPEFGVLFARLRDRISALRAFYGEGPLDIDFRGMAERARAVRFESAQMEPVAAFRRSGRTGQRHSLGGWVGEAEYRGELSEFVPYLRLGQWTGVGRQTVWGKGEIHLEVLD